MHIKTQHRPDYSIVQLIGELDHHCASFVRNELDNIISSKQQTDMVLDLKNLKFMDSSGLGVILGRYKKLKKYGKKLYVKNVNRQIEKVFNVSGIYSIVKKI